MISDWWLKLPMERIISVNGASLFVSTKLNCSRYNGEKGYGITTHNDDNSIKYYGYCASINDQSSILTYYFDKMGIKRYRK